MFSLEKIKISAIIIDNLVKIFNELIKLVIFEAYEPNKLQ